jgi:hypothetical protein
MLSRSEASPRNTRGDASLRLSMTDPRLISNPLGEGLCVELSSKP